MAVAATLVERLRESDLASDILGFSDSKKRKVVEDIVAEYGGNLLIAEALSGGFSIYDAVMKLHERYRGLGFWLPVLRSREYERRLEAADVPKLLPSVILTPPSQSDKLDVWFYDKLINPAVGLLGVYGLVGFISSNGLGVMGAVSFAVAAAGFVILATYVTRRIELDKMVRDSQYLDTKISQLRNGNA